MGFYPLSPASMEYVLGVPSVAKSTIRLSNGRVFTVIAENLSDENHHVERVLLNGVELDRSYIIHSDIMAGGELKFIMKNMKI